MKNALKILLKIVVLFGTLFYLGYAMVEIDKPVHEDICKGLEIYVHDKHNTHFFTANDVRDILVEKNLYLEGQSLDSIQLYTLEEELLKNPTIDSVLCHKTNAKKISIEVIPREPVLHILNNKGEDFYIDNKGSVIPRGHHIVDLVILTGNVTTSTAGKRYTQLGLYILNDEFWNHQIEEIHITDNNIIELTPRVGEHTIILGDTSQLDNKMKRLRAFYEQGLNKAGWNRYKTINLQFDNQIVCVHADSIKPKM